MRFLAYITIMLFCSAQVFGQKITPPKKTVGEIKIVKFTPPKKNSPIINTSQLYGNYTIIKYYKLVKKGAKKKEIERLTNSMITLSETQLSGVELTTLSFSIYEIEKMKKDDYLYRVFNQVISTNIAELTTTITVHKTDSQQFFGIIQLPSEKIAFPYKGGIIIAQTK